MTKTFKSENIKCINCANMIKNSLEEEFGEIQVNLDATPKEVSVEIKDEAQEAKFKEEMSDLGFDVINE